MKRLLIGLGCVAAILAGFIAVPIIEDTRLLSTFEHQDPVLEARTAVAHGDHRLLAGNYGWGEVTPGIDPRASDHDSLVATHGTRVVVQMSDEIASDRQRRLKEASLSYLRRYNAEILVSGR